MVSIRAWPLSIMAALTACASPYVPPQSGPTASVNITMHNLFGDATLDIDSPNDALVHQTVIGQHPPSGTAETTIQVAADQPVRFAFQEIMGTGQCSMQFLFAVAPDQTYDMFVGDFAPAPAKTTVGKIGRFIFPNVGKGCFVGVQQRLSNGLIVPIPVHRAQY
jgi:hypothetical protein